MGAPLKVLVVEDSEDDSELLLHELRRGGFDLSWKRVETEDALRAALEENAWDVVTSDYEMPRLSAPKALEVLKESGRDVPFIVVSGVISMERAVELMRAGAHDFVEKNDLARLVPAIERGLRGAEEHRGRKRAEGLLQDAIENMADGFALFDAEDRFVLCNENYRNILSGIADQLVPGTSFEDMTRAFAERGLIAVEADHIDDWFRTRVSQHRRRRFPRTSIQRRPLDPLGRAPDKRRGPGLYPYRQHQAQAGRGPDRASRTARRPHRSA